MKVDIPHICSYGVVESSVEVNPEPVVVPCRGAAAYFCWWEEDAANHVQEGDREEGGLWFCEEHYQVVAATENVE